MFKANNKDTRTTPSLMLTLNIFHTLFQCFYCQLCAGWVIQIFLGLKAVKASFHVPKLFRLYAPQRRKKSHFFSVKVAQVIYICFQNQLWNFRWAFGNAYLNVDHNIARRHFFPTSFTLLPRQFNCRPPNIFSK